MLIISISGCGLFTTREPEDPSGLSGSGWQFPSSPGDVMENLTNAFGSRSSVDYLRSFSPGDNDDQGFVFIADPETIRDFPVRFSNWGITREQKFAESIFHPTVTPLDSIVAFDYTIERESFIGDSSRISANYDLHIGHMLEDLPTDFNGRCELTLHRSADGGWFVTRWEDFRSESSVCLSDLKAQF